MAITSKSRLFTPQIIRKIVDNSAEIKPQNLSMLSGSNLRAADRSFKFDPPGTGLKSTQQIPIDWSKFENHTFFNSAEAKVNTSFDMIINNYPFDGDADELDKFFDQLTGYERYIFDQFPKHTGSLGFKGAVTDGSYIEVNDKSGALFPSLGDATGQIVLDPGHNSLAIEFYVYLPFDEQNGNQIICQKLDCLGQTGFTVGLTDSRLKNIEVQMTGSSGELLWDDTGIPTSAPDLGYDPTYDPAAGIFGPHVGMSEPQWAEVVGYDPVKEIDVIGNEFTDLFFLVSSGSAHLSGTMEIPKGRWSHVCALYDRTAGEQNIKMFLDSELISTSERSYAMHDMGAPLDPDDVAYGYDVVGFRTSRMYIGSGSIHYKGDWQSVSPDPPEYAEHHEGGHCDTDPPDGLDISYDPETGSPISEATYATDINGKVRTSFIPTQTFSGSLDEFRVWHEVRTPGVINAQRTKNIFSSPADTLKLCFRFNEPYGEHEGNNIVLDHGGQGLHAYIQNFVPSLRDPSMLTNPLDGRFGDPDDPVPNPMVLEKLSLSPILFPSHEDVIELNSRLLEEACWYDTNNPNLITKLIPRHYLLEAQWEEGFDYENGNIGDPYSHRPGQSFPGRGEMGHGQLMSSLLYTWARYFDEIKMYLDHFVNVLHVEYDVNDVVADAFLPFVANHYGFELPRVFTDASIGQFKEGENITPDQGLSDLSLQFVQNQIWRRVLANMNEMMRTKGTRQSLKSLFASMGINPDKLIRFREYGGSRTQDLKDIRRNRTEVSALIDFSGTLAGDSGHRPAPGTGNPFLDSSGRMPWEGTPCEDDVTSLEDTAFVTPFMMSPFLSGSRTEVGAVQPDTDIPVAYTHFTIDFSLPGDPDASTITSDSLLDVTILDRKILELKDINDVTTYFQLMIDDKDELSNEAFVRIDLTGIFDRVDIADKVAETISAESDFRAYNVSTENNGVIKIYQPSGGRAGNLPIKMHQYDGDSMVGWNGLYQHRDPSGALLWKVPDNEDGTPNQAYNLDKKLFWTNDNINIVIANSSADGTFGTLDEDMPAAGFVPVYQLLLSDVGFEDELQETVWNVESTALIGVWEHIATGEVVTHEDIGVLSDAHVPPTYLPVTNAQSQTAYASQYGYTESYYDVPYFNIDNNKAFADGALGIIKHDHPDLSYDESVFIKENGNFHGFDLTPNDGLFTSGSWTVEGLYKFDKPALTFYPVTQSLIRVQSTVDNDLTVEQEENNVLLANLVIMRQPEFDQETGQEIIVDDGTVKLFVKPALKEHAMNEVLELTVTGTNIFDGQQWYISFGRQRADQIESAISASYFLRVGRNQRGEIREFYETTSMFQETFDSDNETFWSDKASGVNDWGPYLAVGSQSLLPPDSVNNLGLNTDESQEQSVTNFSGRMGQLRFWSKYLTKTEALEHVRNPFSIGVEDPTRNFNFATTPSGSFERIRLDISFDQPVTASIEDEMVDHVMRLGYMELFDFTQAKVSGSRGALWRTEDTHDEMSFHMMGYGFEAEESIIKPERFDYTTIDAKFDEHGVDNKIRIRGFEQTENIEEFQVDVAPVYEILPSEKPNDDTRFSLDISSFQGLNDDIIKIFATLDSLDNMIGAPELVFSDNYPDLASMRELYFNRLTGKVKIRSFFEFFKWFDNAAGNIIEKLIPRKTHFMGINFVIESHMLERAKITYNYSDTYLGPKNRSGLKGTILLQQFVGQVKRF